MRQVNLVFEFFTVQCFRFNFINAFLEAVEECLGVKRIIAFRDGWKTGFCTLEE
jgi:hypothetical protein